MRSKIMLLVVVLISALGGWYWYTQTEEYQSRKFLNDWEAAYRNDTYGGATPEETLQLFTDALKKGDTDLAAKYFVVGEQGKYIIDLENDKKNNRLKDILSDLSQLKLTKKTESEAFYIIKGLDGVVESQVVLGISRNGRWKILEL